MAAQYVIEVASEISGADATTAELDALAAQMTGAAVMTPKANDSEASLNPTSLFSWLTWIERKDGG